MKRSGEVSTASRQNSMLQGGKNFHEAARAKSRDQSSASASILPRRSHPKSIVSCRERMIGRLAKGQCSVCREICLSQLEAAREKIWQKQKAMESSHPKECRTGEKRRGEKETGKKKREAEGNYKRDTVKRVLSYIGAYRLLVLFSLVLAAVTVALTLTSPSSSAMRWI